MGERESFLRLYMDTTCCRSVDTSYDKDFPSFWVSCVLTDLHACYVLSWLHIHAPTACPHCTSMPFHASTVSSITPWHVARGNCPMCMTSMPRKLLRLFYEPRQAPEGAVERSTKGNTTSMPEAGADGEAGTTEKGATTVTAEVTGLRRELASTRMVRVICTSCVRFLMWSCRSPCMACMVWVVRRHIISVRCKRLVLISAARSPQVDTCVCSAVGDRCFDEKRKAFRRSRLSFCCPSRGYRDCTAVASYDPLTFWASRAGASKAQTGPRG